MPRKQYVRERKPWPSEYSGDYDELKTQLSTMARLTERASTMALFRERDHLKKFVPMIRMFSRRLLQTCINIAAWKRNDRGGAYWINDVLESIEYFSPAINDWVSEVEALIDVHIWAGVNEKLTACLNAINCVQVGYTKDDGTHRAGLLSGPGPSRRTHKPVDDSLIRDAEAFLGLDWKPDLTEAKLSKNGRQKTRIPSKPKRRKPIKTKSSKNLIPCKDAD